MRNIELRKKYKEEENAKVEIAEINDRSFINYEYVFWLENMLVENLSLSAVIPTLKNKEALTFNKYLKANYTKTNDKYICKESGGWFNLNELQIIHEVYSVNF